MRGYEAIFIFRPSLNEEERTKLVEKIEKIISTNGTLHEANYWGRKRFAYQIQKFSDGHFYLFVFDCEATIPLELKRLTKITETILRSMIIVRKTTYRAKEVPPPATPEPVAPVVVKEEPTVEETPALETVTAEEVVATDLVEEVKIEDANAE